MIAAPESRSLAPRALYRPQGTCPKPWVAQVNGETLFDARGGQRRFSTEAAAKRAAIAYAEAR